jgi:hypothetical protein
MAPRERWCQLTSFLPTFRHVRKSPSFGTPGGMRRVENWLYCFWEMPTAAPGIPRRQLPQARRSASTDGHGPGEQEALGAVAAELGERIALRLPLDALGHGRIEGQVENVAHLEEPHSAAGAYGSTRSPATASFAVPAAAGC